MIDPEDLAEKILVALIVELVKDGVRKAKEKAPKPRQPAKHLRDEEAK